MEKPRGMMLQPGTALVVEDEPLVRAFAAEALMDAGYHVLEACDARDALAILDDRREVRIVLTDIEMPGEMDGLALASTIRIRWPEIVVLVNSGRVQPEEDAIPSGAGFIAKPYRADDLISQLEELVREQHGELVKSDEEILDAWHAAELGLASARAAGKSAAISRAVVAEQAAIERFGLGAHEAAYHARFPDEAKRGG